MEELKTLISSYKAGDSVKLEIERLGNNGYEKQSVKVTLGSTSDSSYSGSDNSDNGGSHGDGGR
jgi:hypothetical protein